MDFGPRFGSVHCFIRLAVQLGAFRVAAFLGSKFLLHAAAFL
jgi:hypothetical protein